MIVSFCNPTPVNCTDGSSVLKGEYVRITTETSQPVDSCSYSLENPPGNFLPINPDNRSKLHHNVQCLAAKTNKSTTITCHPLLVTNADQLYAFFRSGKINYDCNSGNENITGSFQVVEARHQISLCSSCATKDFVVSQGDVVSWTFGNENFCNVELYNASSCTTSQQLSGELINIH